MNERAPVSFRSAKPVDPKTRHPFSGEVLDEQPFRAPTKDSPDSELSPVLGADSQGDYILDTRVAAPAAYSRNSIRETIAVLKHQRDDIDKAIKLLERLA